MLVDTNILIYAVRSKGIEHQTCIRLLRTWQTGYLPWFSTWPIFNEFLRVVTHPKTMTGPLKISEAWSFLDSLLVSPSLHLLVPGPRHADIARQTFEEHPDLCGNILHDAHTAILMREHGIRRIYTRDRDFERFPFLEVIDPLTAA